MRGLGGDMKLVSKEESIANRVSTLCGFWKELGIGFTWFSKKVKLLTNDIRSNQPSSKLDLIDVGFGLFLSGSNWIIFFKFQSNNFA